MSRPSAALYHLWYACFTPPGPAAGTGGPRGSPEEGVEADQPAHGGPCDPGVTAIGQGGELRVNDRLHRVCDEVQISVARAHERVVSAMRASPMFGIPTTIASRPRRLAHESASSTPHVPAKLSAGSNRFCPSCM